MPNIIIFIVVRCRTNPDLIHSLQQKYVQWVQQDKMRVISQSLQSAGMSQSDIDDGRWKVGDLPWLIEQPLVTRLMNDLEAATIFGLRAMMAMKSVIFVSIMLVGA